MASLLDAYDTILAENTPPVAAPVAVATQHFADNNRDPTAANPTASAASIANPGIAASHLATPGAGGDLLTFPSPPNGDAVANMFADSYGSDLLLNDHGGSLEENNGLSSGHDQDCKICQTKLKSPRVLSCLHVFCEICIAKLCATDPALGYTVECPICKQITKIGAKGVASLHCDYVTTNILDLSSIELRVLACTSCKGKENAISRCNDCANILCASCDNAHQSMRCFENHKVVKLEDLVKSSSSEKMAIHKPLFCTTHATENLKYYCFSCEVPVCNECLIAEHKGGDHVYEIISDAEKCVRIEVENLMKEARGKVDYCDQAACHLGSALNELQTQHDVARDLIEESYQSFKAVLEKCRDNALKELKALHSERELKIMDVLHNVEKSVEKIDNACKFTKRVLDQSNAPELLSLKKLIGCQFLNLVSTTPKAESNYSVEFNSNFEKFERLAHDSFGKFQTEGSPVSPKECTPPPTLPGMPPILISGNQHANGSHNGTSSSSQGALTGSVTASSPISLPTSMQSSFDGDMSGLGNGSGSSASGSSGFALPTNLAPECPTPAPLVNGATVPPPTTVSATPALPGLSRIAEYNIHQLANLVEHADLADPIIPSSNPSPSPQFTLADVLSGDQNAFNNLQALAKLGLNNTPIANNHRETSQNMNRIGSNWNITSGNSLISRGPSPGVDNILINEFSGNSIMPNGTSMSSLSDDLTISNFQSSISVPGRSKATPMQIRCKFGSLGASKGQFNSPHGFCLGVDEEIIVADTNNHRIEIFEKNGAFKFQFGVPGKEEGQLWYPRKVAVMRPTYKFVVCDRGNERSRMQIFNKTGHFMKKIAIRYIDIVAGLAVTNQGHIVAVDSVSPTVFIITEEGDLVHWFDCSNHMREPSDIAISGNDFYVCDFKGHCVAVFTEDGTFKYRIGNEKVTCFPNGIDISDAGDILIGDSHGNRFHVACFSREGVLQSEYECPYVKVSRCCGLKITSEGYVVTLAKNNHHVLVLNTLYIQ
ncbi:brain tumor protein [Phlebotomus argentipes]|uniref:brain tumor protein n=1 Tax=Phlebotomus argentipes TaxID=94469 RepID=UPI002893755C|nr:brain tumor protein [Phlebotomus argentipes]XP_059618822.1 brain tumor protein [Phlebotomus argentipes]